MSNIPVIVGAGPVGLGAAVLLRQAGIPARIVDMAPEPSNHSKAMAVNPRTLELLESTGVTAKMLSAGIAFAVRVFRMTINGAGNWT